MSLSMAPEIKSAVSRNGGEQNHILSSPLQLGKGHYKAVEEQGEEGGEDAERDDLFSEKASPSLTNQTTPDWTITPSASPAAVKNQVRSSPFGSGARPSSPSRHAVAPALARPLYQERTNSGSSTPPDVRTRKQLMPNIPARKESFGPQNESSPSIKKNLTNIQSLAQAIAARAQHVAAANALAKAGEKPGEPSISTSSDASVQPSETTAAPVAGASKQTEEGKRTSHAGSVPRSVSQASTALPLQEDEGEDQVAPLTSVEQQQQRNADTVTPGIAPVDSRQKEEADRWSKSSWLFSGAAVREKDATGTEDADSTDTFHGGKLRTSDSDHSVSTAQTSYDRHSLPGGSVKLVGPPRRASASDPSQVYKDNRITTSEEGMNSAQSRLEGLGIADTADLLPFHLSSPSSAVATSTSLRSLDSFATAPELNGKAGLSETLFPTSPSMAESSPTSSTSPRTSVMKRKSKPAALSLNTSSPAPRTPTMRTVASPTTARTPPPTMPPDEPLPPIPPLSASAGIRRHTGKLDSLSSPLTSIATHQGLLAATFANALGSSMEEGERSRPRQDSDPVPNSSSFEIVQTEATKRHSSPVRRQSSTKLSNNLGSKSAALINATNAHTKAGAESAQAVLAEIKSPHSYDEKRASQNSTKQASSQNDAVSTSLTRDIQPTSSAAAPGLHRTSAISEGLSSSTDGEGGLPYDQASIGEEADEGEDDGDDMEEEAVVTRVISRTGSISSNLHPTMGRSTSDPLLNPVGATSAVRSEDSGHATGAAAPVHNIVGRMRARIESRTPKTEAEAGQRKPTAQPPSAWSNRPKQAPSGLVESQSTKAVTGTPEGRAPSVATPTLSVTHSDFGNSSLQHGLWSTNDRREEDGYASSLSPDHSMRNKEARAHSSASFSEVARAFKQLQAEKKALERVIRATTPLPGVGDGQDLSQYLSSMTSKLALSAAEIRRLLDLLDQQKSVMDYMQETHQLQLEAQANEADELQQDLEDAELEAETHRANCIKLTEQLDRAHSDAVAARAETLRLKTTLTDEEGKRDKFARLLRLARDDIAKAQDERGDMERKHREGEDAHSVTKKALEGVHTEHASEVAVLKEELAALKSTLEAQKTDKEAREERGFESQASNSSAHINWHERVATLVRELHESRQAHTQSERLLQELKSSPKIKDEASIGSLSPTHGGSSEVEEALRDKVMQQEKDIAELRAAIAFGAGAKGTTDEQLANLPAGRADQQMQVLLADLAEKRAREVQIRSAYKQLRDEMRKMQLAQQQDRKRSQASFSYLAGGAGPSSASSQGHGGVPPSSYFGVGGSVDSSAPTTPNGSGPTPRQLKRLSLPLVNKSLNGFGTTGLDGHPVTLLRSAAARDASLDSNPSHGMDTSLDRGDEYGSARGGRNAAAGSKEEDMESLESPTL